ncbi:RNA 3'-terminal phosphate cyclase family protein [Tricharina praecox]|uniref:RNA 3'-terminal phosphate cyclase family protein n=1 Tax=Tricharina praecox TaxID=43433 RepID=UPI00222042D6|nr:RNA 3'-terminal phosphate cyclase family protein [Tricharina praecox]KAI5844317.1 RNA 3'-terminal phosphate cyclase family protein [Tricharina praecox]
MTTPIKFSTHANLRHRLVLATLTGTPLHITQIRSNSLTPGLTPSEFSLLRLLDTLTNGAFFEVSVTGTTFLYRPGLITGNGGKPVTHVLPETCTRGVSYYLEVLALLAPFSKASFSVTLTGGVITAATELDASVDTFRTAYLPLFAKFDISRGLELRIIKRSAGPHGAGEVQFVHGHQVRLPKTLHLQTPGRVKKIRGVAYAIGVSAGNNARMIEAARGVLNRFIPDVYVFSDVAKPQIVPADYGKEGAAERAGGVTKGRAGGKTKKVGVGFGMSLLAESGTGCIYSADATAAPSEPAEDVGRRVAFMLLEEIALGGCVGRTGAMAVLTMMMMGVEGDVGRVVLGKDLIDDGFVSCLRDMKKVFGSEVGIRDAQGKEGNVIVSVVGKGVGNVGRKLA